LLLKIATDICKNPEAHPTFGALNWNFFLWICLSIYLNITLTAEQDLGT